MRQGPKGIKYYIITGSSGCLSTDYYYLSKKVNGRGIVLEPRKSSANEYPES